MDIIQQLIQQLEAESGFAISANDPTLQFEVDGQELLFSSLLPERTVEKNEYRDFGVKFKTMIANDGTRYSPPQKKGGMMMSSVMVELGNSDTATEMNQQQYEHFIRFLDRGITQEAVFALLRFFESGVSRPLALLRERHRVEAIVKGYVHRKGANNFEEIVQLSKPPGHRVTVPSGTAAAPAGWYDPDYSILSDLKAKKLMLQRKGYRVTRIITTADLIADCMVKNNEIRLYGISSVQTSAGVVTLPVLSENQALLNAFAAAQIPNPETYEQGYSDQEGYHLYMKDCLIMVCATGRSQDIKLGDESPIVIPDTIGYYGVGTATGQLSPGIATKVESFDGKDARIEAMGWQTSFPVIQEPEAFVVFNIPKPL